MSYKLVSFDGKGGVEDEDEAWARSWFASKDAKDVDTWDDIIR